jgi:ribosomal protein S12 methylthiotransferase
VRRVAEIPGLHWVRLQYLYPERLSEELIALLAEHPRVVPYVDMPVQHACTPLLRLMRRGHSETRLRQLVRSLRRQVPGLVLRTAFMVGHPGESRAHFARLLEFVSWAQFDHVGVFCYSDEEGTRSQQLSCKVAARIANSRARRLLALQRPISRSKNAARVGQQLAVLVEGPSEDSERVMVGRHAGQAPEIDGQVYLSGVTVRAGQMVQVRVAQATDYDLLGEVVEPADTPDQFHAATSNAQERLAPSSNAALVHRSSDGRRVSLRTS